MTRAELDEAVRLARIGNYTGNPITDTLARAVLAMAHYRTGQRDVFSWLEGVTDDAPGAPIDSAVYRERAWRWCLAANLAVAAGLCMAHRLGYQRGIHDGWGRPDPKPWRPGCQRPAPGWGGK